MIIRNPLLFGICPPSCIQLQHQVSKASCISNLMCKPKQVDSLEAVQCLSVALSKGSTTQACARGRKQNWLLKCSAVTVWQTTEEVQSKKSVSKFSAISENGVTVWPCCFRPGFLQLQNVQKKSPCQFIPHPSNVFSKGWCLQWQHQLYQTMHLLQDVPFNMLMKMTASPHTKKTCTSPDVPWQPQCSGTP